MEVGDRVGVAGGLLFPDLLLDILRERPKSTLSCKAPLGGSLKQATCNSIHKLIFFGTSFVGGIMSRTREGSRWLHNEGTNKRTRTGAAPSA